VTASASLHDATGPELTETVNVRTGLIRASGHLTSLGADLLSGTADSLRGEGHRRVVLDLTDVRAADSAGLDILSELERSFAAEGGQLVVRRSPGETVGG
jgi:anti-anti-sigma regulatory factor